VLPARRANATFVQFGSNLGAAGDPAPLDVLDDRQHIDVTLNRSGP
jgi:hypothetical protein